MHHPTDRIAHTTAFVTPVVEHWLEREIAQWVSLLEAKQLFTRRMEPQNTPYRTTSYRTTPYQTISYRRITSQPVPDRSRVGVAVVVHVQGMSVMVTEGPNEKDLPPSQWCVVATIRDRFRDQMELFCLLFVLLLTKCQ